MKSYLLQRIELLRDHLAGQFQLFQRQGGNGEDCYWGEAVEGAQEPVLDQQATSSPKQFFFAEREAVFKFDGQCFRETLPQPAPFALFGVSSCDLVAIAYQDRFFAEDPYYQARRQQALLVGVDCLSPCEYGFCPTVDAGPGVRETTADLILHPMKDGEVLLIVGSDKGQQALAGLELKRADNEAAIKRNETLENCEQQFPDDQAIRQGITHINQQAVSDLLWQKMGIQCLSCSGCTTLCPSCSCYGTRDISDASGIVRERFWDSCLYEGFQREASHYNPSAEAGDRVKRFWTHKFSDDFVNEFTRYGCVGCGRCEQTCPGVIGVHSVMKRICVDADANA